MNLEFSDIDVAWEVIQEYKKHVSKVRGYYTSMSDILFDTLQTLENCEEIKSFVRDLVVITFDSGYSKDSVIHEDPNAWYCNRPAKIIDWWTNLQGDVEVSYSFVVDKERNLDNRIYKGTKEDSLFDEANTHFLLDMIHDELSNRITK